MELEHRPPTPRRRRTWLDARTVAVPLALVVLLVALAAWRSDGGAGGVTDPAPTRTAPRTFGDVAVDAPSSWRELDRTARHVTWGSADRSHTVTLASTEASPVALPVVVREVASGSDAAIPGAQLVAGPVELELGERASRGDAAVLVELAVPTRSGQPLSVTQVWRRDVRAGVDVVATWTSADGRWPASPRTAIPHATGSR